MDPGEPYASRIVLIVAAVIASLVGAVIATRVGLQMADRRAALTVVDAQVSGFDGVSPRVTFRDELGVNRTLTLNRVSGRTDRIGDKVQLAYPVGQWTNTMPVPQPAVAYLVGAGFLLVGPLLVVHDRRVRQRLAIARSPTNLQPVHVEVRTSISRASSGSAVTTGRVAMISFAGTGSRAPDAKVRLTPFCRLSDGRYPGEIAGDLRVGGPVVLWIAGQPVRVAGNLRRA